MPSPFLGMNPHLEQVGMNPYLEQEGALHDFHEPFIPLVASKLGVS